jgi:mRNA-degrading endonuclease RelE of RelBE toxin-antitoxin system
MREIEIAPECLEFIDDQEERVREKFFQLIEVISELRIVHSSFIKKLKSTDFYELRIKAGNEYRVIIFSIDNANFNECTKAICLTAFLKKSTKDYKKAIKKAEKVLQDYTDNN